MRHSYARMHGAGGRTCEAMRAQSSEEIRRRLRRAYERRQAHLRPLGIVQEAWRVANGAADGAPAGLTLDRYGLWLVLCAREEIPEAVTCAWAAAALDELGADGLVVKTLSRAPGASTSRVYAGEIPDGPIPIREGDAVLLCDLDDGLSTGLYLDLHDVRRGLGGLVGGGEVLNLFAHTGAFSVHAALAGADRVTSVDVSKKALRRSRQNMEANEIDPAGHRFFADDVLRALERAGRRSERYALVIVDPPAFGRVGGRTFKLERDLEPLVDRSAGLVEAGGKLLVSTHSRGVDRARIVACASRSGRRIEVLAEHGLPEWDHPTVGPAQGDRGDYLQVLVVGVV